MLFAFDFILFENWTKKLYVTGFLMHSASASQTFGFLSAAFLRLAVIMYKIFCFITKIIIPTSLFVFVSVVFIILLS